MKSNNKIIIVIPFENKEKDLVKFIDYLKIHKDLFDFIFVDNASSDRSQEILKLNKVSFLHSSFKLTYTKALQIGLDYAKIANYEIVVECGNFTKYNYKSILKIIENFSFEKVDLLLGNGIKMKKSKRISKEKILKFFNYLLTGKTINGIDTKFKIFNKKILNYINLKPNYSLRPDDITFLMLNKNNKIESINVLLNEKWKIKRNFWNFLQNFKETFIWVLFILLVVPFRRKIFSDKEDSKKGKI